MIFLPTLGTVTSFEPRQGDSVPHGLAEQKKKNCPRDAAVHCGTHYLQKGLEVCVCRFPS